MSACIRYGRVKLRIKVCSQAFLVGLKIFHLIQRSKKWLAAEERFKQEMQMKNILPAVADQFLIESNGNRAGASLLCFDEIQVSLFVIILEVFSCMLVLIFC